MPLDPLATLRDLVATPSVNPMGRAGVGPEFYEHRLTDFLERLFARLDIPTWRQPVAPQRENLLARLDGDPPLDGGGQLVLFDAHQDTVPVDGMSVPPFEPQVRDGRLYGRGACDIKGGMAAMLVALARLAEERPSPRPTVVMSCTVNEEYGFTGAAALARLFRGEDNPILPRPPDAAIIAEPTSLDVVSAHKGMVRWRCHAHGRAAHSSSPQQGVNAIFIMARVLAALERYQREVVGNLTSPGTAGLYGAPTLSVGTIAGGLSVNTVPDRCTIEIDRRLVPGEDPQAAWQHVVDFVAGQLAADVPCATAVSAVPCATGVSPVLNRDGVSITHDQPFMQSPGLSGDTNRPLAERLAATAAKVMGTQARILTVPFGTNAPLIAATGVPCVVFGPGSVEQAHAADEWVSVDEVEWAAEVLYQLVRDWGLGSRE